AIKLVTGLGETLVERLLLYDALAMRFSTLAIAKDPSCPVCGDAPTITALKEENTTCDIPASDTLGNGAASTIQPRELRALLDHKETLALLDVREPYEREIVALANTHEIPLAELEKRMHELPEDRDIVVYCRSGARSAQAVSALRKAGFARARNLERGILGWIDDVDPSLARY
ncbi:MAG: molybdenum cofactor biosynthesis protein MoeB, partial [Candidatus Eremiobacteraeota bacterium]|nr:molybdenum cofactor biosynthesis protein MoeB [Candidatus Eremiobacteraeota bacterium]